MQSQNSLLKNILDRYAGYEELYDELTQFFAQDTRLMPASIEAKTRPNILFLQTDNQRWDALGCSGNPIIHTPNIDRLAAQGAYFTHVFATTPICAASRASILTGLYRRRHNFTFLQPPLRTEFTDISYPTLLKQAGYYTGLIGKLGIESHGKLLLENEAETLSKMFDVFDNFEHWTKEGYEITQEDGSQKHLTEITGDKVIDFLNTCPKDRPFCLSVSFNAPHAQDGDPRHFIWPSAEDSLYEDATLPVTKTADPDFFNSLPEFLQNNENRKRWHTRFDSHTNYQHHVKGYYRMISGVDRMVGRFVDELERQGLSDNTIIFFTSDHGFMIGERGYSDCWLMYDGSLRVPLIIYDPRVNPSARGIIRNELALNIDLSPTILELAGIEVPPMVQGKSLVPLLYGNQLPWRQDFFCEHVFNTPTIVIPRSEGVRTQRWKYIRYFDQNPIWEELYDLKKDPEEAHNLRDDPNCVLKLDKLRKRCDELLRSIQSSTRTSPIEDLRYE